MKLVQNMIECLFPSRNERLLMALVVVTTLIIAAVNVNTIFVDAMRQGIDVDPRAPWVFEYSSAFVLLLLYPGILAFTRRLPLDTENWKWRLPAYLAFSLLFSALHIAGMVAIRKLVFWLYFDGAYIFFGDVLRELSYEYRKDFVTFILFTGLAQIVLNIPDTKGTESTQKPSRLVLKNGAQSVVIEPDSFRHARAAGNYIEVFTGTEMHLIRMSLAKFEAMLTEADMKIARIHRSHIVSLAEIAKVSPKNDGDAEVSLRDGTRLPASRRYRKSLEASL